MSTNTKENLHHEAEAKTFIKDYWQERAAGFMQLRLKELHSEKYKLWQQEIAKHLPQGKPLKILDVGCGAGFFSILLAKSGYNVTGIDLTPAMIEEAKLLAQSQNCNAIFTVMDAEALAFTDNSFDAVIARNVTWNLPHPDVAYKQWLRVLKPGGLLLNYDAEYARDHHRQLPAHNAHANVSKELLERCHRIYHMLDVSLYERPVWDESLLTQLGATKVTIDKTVGKRIYATEDDFYSPAPMFGVFATK